MLKSDSKNGKVERNMSIEIAGTSFEENFEELKNRLQVNLAIKIPPNVFSIYFSFRIRH